MSSSHNSFRQPVRLGLIGSGFRMRGVIRRLLAHAPAGSVEVTAVYDPDLRSTDALRKLLGRDVESAATDSAVAAHPDVDWVFIGSWNSFHARQALMAIEAGKNVFCEKPLATSVEDCLAICDAVRASGSIFALGLVLRYSPHYRKIREILDSGKLGQIISFEFNETLPFNHGGYIFGDWRRYQEFSGGHVLEKCCHDLDLANWYCGSLPVRVASFGGRRFFVPENAGRAGEIGPDPAGMPAYSQWRRFAPDLVDPFTGGADIMDHQTALIEYANGVQATFHTNCNSAIPERRFYINGTHGALRADLITNRIEVAKIGWDTAIESMVTGSEDAHGGGDEEMAVGLYRTLMHGEPPQASIPEGLYSAVTALAIDEAMQSRQVVDLEPYWTRANGI